MTAFATPEQLGTRLNRTFTAGEKAWMQELLEDASEHLRTVIEQEVYPRRQTTYTDWPTGGRVDLLQTPVVSIDAVVRDGAPIDYELFPGYLKVTGDEPVTLTYTFGLANPPRELARLACVLVSQTLIPLEQQLGLTVGGLSSIAIDDFRMAFANAGEQTGMSLTRHAERSIRRKFGRGDVTVGEAAS